MAAAGSSVVRRVEELGDLAQAHIQHLSEAAGEDGEGRRREGEAGGRTAQSWLPPWERGLRPAVGARPVRGPRSVPQDSHRLQLRRGRRGCVFIARGRRAHLSPIRAAGLALPPGVLGGTREQGPRRFAGSGR